MRQIVGIVGAALVSLAPAMAQNAPVSHELTGGGSVSLRRDGDRLLVTVTGSGAGLASLCLGDDSRVKILHASAAVGEATYDKSGTGWALAEGFDFTLRETRSGPPPETERRAFFDARGWVANANNGGTVPREFSIRLDSRARFLGVAFYVTTTPEALAYWPATMNDDCRAVKVAQGYLPQTAQFSPATWFRIP